LTVRRRRRWRSSSSSDRLREVVGHSVTRLRSRVVA
jgi:hypothetical protein